MPDNGNLKIWDALGKTDPKHTKKFQRSGGFKGTAIKPIWLAMRMTEYFGPCGIGWGPDMPQFSVERSAEEGMVFCTVGLWYKDPSNGERGQVYGVGGDKFIIAQNSGLRTSDEAFKAAYTDALGNAMKLIGVAADVHMGLFDDNKYIGQMEREFGTDLPDPKPFKPASADVDYREQMERDAKAKATIITSSQAKAFRDACLATGYSGEAVKKALADAGITSSAKIPAADYKQWMEWALATAEVPA